MDTSVKWTSRDGPCVSLLPLFDSLQEGHHLVLVPMVFVLGRVKCIVYQYIKTTNLIEPFFLWGGEGVKVERGG